MGAEGGNTLRVSLVSNHPMLMQPLTRWLSRDGSVESSFVDLRGEAYAAQCRRNGSSVIVVDHASANGSLPTVVGALHTGVPGAKVLLLAPRTDAESMRVAVEAGCAGLVSCDQPPESLLSAVLAAHGMPLEAKDERSSMKPLTGREEAVLRLLADGLSTAELADELGITRNTARAHVQHVIEKLGVHSKLSAVAAARRLGYL